MANAETPRQIEHTDSAALHKRRAAGEQVQLLDVREPLEHAGGVIQGAILMPMGSVQAKWTELDAQQPVYVICRLGGRSAQVAAFLTRQGVRAINVDDGMDGWERYGFPTEVR
ncbi:MAG TPA: rhodanese-like domain-containing protein [Chloroflexota bacterium]|nr:rhodanese-like domain-containing protein [Chloroflexota bacterium]